MGTVAPLFAKMALEKLFREGKLFANPDLTLEVISRRPVVVLGEANSPGSYPYVEGVRVVNAIAAAGGLSYRADKDSIVVSAEDGTVVGSASFNTPLHPGDVLEVRERYF